MRELTLDDLKRYQRNRRKEVRERPVNIELQILVNTLKDANLWRGVLPRYKRLKEPESEIGQALSLDQLRMLEDTAAKNDAWQVAYLAEILAANTGLRGGEIKKLRLAMLDLDNRRIHISRDSTKTNAGARIIELNQSAMSAAYKLYIRALALGAAEPDHYLLPADLSRHTHGSDPLRGQRGFNPTWNQMSWNTGWRNLRRAVVAAILDRAKQEGRELRREERYDVKVLGNVRFQDLRHTFITLMAERGVPLPIVQTMVGHMSDRMTRHYTHISSQAARQAVELLDQERLVGDFVGKAIPAKTGSRRLLN